MRRSGTSRHPLRGYRARQYRRGPREVFRITHGHEGSTQLLKVTFVETSDTRMAIIRDMQFDPVSENLIHVDLQEVAMDKPIQVTVALHHVGEPIGVRDTRASSRWCCARSRSPACPAISPTDIKADVSNLAIGDVLTVGDLIVPEGVRVLTDRAQAVATSLRRPPRKSRRRSPPRWARRRPRPSRKCSRSASPRKSAEAEDKKGKK